jgi:hypothetical protein
VRAVKGRGGDGTGRARIEVLKGLMGMTYMVYSTGCADGREIEREREREREGEGERKRATEREGMNAEM